MRIGEVGDDRAGCGVADPEIEMRRVRIVEVDGPLYQPHPQKSGKELFDLSRVGADRGDVVHPLQAHVWRGWVDWIWPRLGGDGRLVTMARRCFPGRQLDLRTQGIQSLIECPAWSARRDLEDQTIRIGEVDAFEVDPVVGAGNSDSGVGKPALPLQQRIAILRLEREMVRPADSVRPSGGTFPLEERQYARSMLLVGEIEVIRRRIVEVDRLFDQAQAERSGVKVHRALGVSGNGRQVMDSIDPAGGGWSGHE